MELLPTYKELKIRFPLLQSQELFVRESRQIISNIINGLDARYLLIVGPCSIHDSVSARDFAYRLHQLSSSISSHFYPIMRVFCEKPRTNMGWKGFLYDPLLDNSHAMSIGLQWTRQLLLDLATLQLPAAVEFLDPLTASYYEDLVSWGSIGARTSSSQIHRQLASGLCMPIGFKNSVIGDISAAIHGVAAASMPHIHMCLSEDGQPIALRTKGNEDAHVVLRGGEAAPNFDRQSIQKTIQHLERLQLKPIVCIDCSHHNSRKQHIKQVDVFKDIIQQMIEGNSYIRGVMLESHLYAGSQDINDNNTNLQYGVSITDDCLDWETTARLIQWGVERLQQSSSWNDTLLSRHST